MENNYYIYFHINPLYNKVFYVGKGKDKRAWNKRGRSQYWRNTINKYGYIVDIVEDNLTEDEAFQREKFYINKIGRNNLVNLTDGGEGVSNPTEETRKKMSDASKGNKFALGLKHTKETKQKISESHIGNKFALGRKHTEETIKKIKGHIDTEQTRKNKSNSQKGRIHTEETRKKMSESAKLRHQIK